MRTAPRVMTNSVGIGPRKGLVAIRLCKFYAYQVAISETALELRINRSDGQSREQVISL